MTTPCHVVTSMQAYLVFVEEQYRSAAPQEDRKRFFTEDWREEFQRQQAEDEAGRRMGVPV